MSHRKKKLPEPQPAEVALPPLDADTFTPRQWDLIVDYIGLSRREEQSVQGVMRGGTAEEVAASLGIRYHGVNKCLGSAYRKFARATGVEKVNSKCLAYVCTIALQQAIETDRQANGDGHPQPKGPGPKR